MKLKFKEQEFQIQAVQAVVDCFEGQPLKTNRFTLERSRELIRKAKQAATGVQTIQYEIEEDSGYRNAPIRLMDDQVLKNIQEVQKRIEHEDPTAKRLNYYTKETRCIASLHLQRTPPSIEVILLRGKDRT